tara:strand:- start:163 stop:357 length:195 start_codon:yes stop_codon:yes gene_type:complete
MTRSLNVGEILKIQEILTGSNIPSDIQDALDNYTHVTQRGDEVDFGELNIIHVLRAYLKEKRND